MATTKVSIPSAAACLIMIALVMVPITGGLDNGGTDSDSVWSHSNTSSSRAPGLAVDSVRDQVYVVNDTWNQTAQATDTHVHALNLTTGSTIWYVTGRWGAAQHIMYDAVNDLVVVHTSGDYTRPLLFFEPETGELTYEWRSLNNQTWRYPRMSQVGDGTLLIADGFPKGQPLVGRVDPVGALDWEVNFTGTFYRALGTGVTNGTAYVLLQNESSSSSRATLIALHLSNGTERWRAVAPGVHRDFYNEHLFARSLVAANSGHVYVATHEVLGDSRVWRLTAWDASGDQTWSKTVGYGNSFATAAHVQVEPSSGHIVVNGLMESGSSENLMTAVFHPTVGSLLWSRWFDLQVAPGLQTPVQSLDFDRVGPSALAPDGSAVYLWGGYGLTSLYTIGYNLTNGDLIWKTVEDAAGLQMPGSLVVSPSGDWLLQGAARDNSIVGTISIPDKESMIFAYND